MPYNRKCWRGLNLAKWPETAIFFKWRFLILANCRLEKYDVIMHTAHVNMVSASAIARISRTQVVEVENCVRGHEVYGAPRSASS